MTKPRRFSQLDQAEQNEILTDPAYIRYETRIKREDWLFSRIETGKLTGKCDRPGSPAIAITGVSGCGDWQFTRER